LKLSLVNKNKKGTMLKMLILRDNPADRRSFE
jgi:hypothetical protein